jgi:hypothetical protein
MPATSARPNCTPPRNAARMTTRPIAVSRAVGAGHAHDLCPPVLHATTQSRAHGMKTAAQFRTP